MGAGRKFLQSCVALILCAGAAAQSRAQNAIGIIPVGNLADADALGHLREIYGARCKKALGIDRSQVQSILPPGSFVSQSPPSGSTITCADTVTIRQSSGSTAANGDPQATKKKRPSWSMPTLGDRVGVARFEQDARGRCGGDTVKVAMYNGQSNVKAGTIYYQQPTAGDPVTCTTQVVATFASGPPRFAVGMLRTTELRARFEHRATAFCGSPYRITLRTTESALAAGSFVDQSAPPATIFSCDMTLSVTLAETAVPPLTSTPTPSVTGSKGISTWRMPDILTASGMAQLGRESSRYCGHTAAIGESVREDGAPDGTAVSQTPSVGALIDCASAFTIVRAREHPPCGTDSPTLPESLFVDDQCHQALIRPWQAKAALIIIAAAVGAIAVRRWRQQVEWRRMLATATIVPGTAATRCEAPAEGLRRLIPDIAVTITSGVPRIDIPAPLTITHEECRDA